MTKQFFLSIQPRNFCDRSIRHFVVVASVLRSGIGGYLHIVKINESLALEIPSEKQVCDQFKSSISWVNKPLRKWSWICFYRRRFLLFFCNVSWHRNFVDTNWPWTMQAECRASNFSDNEIIGSSDAILQKPSRILTVLESTTFQTPTVKVEKIAEVSQNV